MRTPGLHRAVPLELSSPGVRTPVLHRAVPPELSSLRVRTPGLHRAVPPELSSPRGEDPQSGSCQAPTQTPLAMSLQRALPRACSSARAADKGRL